MKFLSRHKEKIIFAAILIAALVFTYLWGGNIPDSNYQDKDSAEVILSEKIANESVSVPVGQSIIVKEEDLKETAKIDQKTEAVGEENTVPVEPDNVIISDREMTCTLAIRCDTILNNFDFLDETKKTLVPSNGIILAEKTVTFYEGESVFDVLLRETRKNNIHMEYVNTPVYNSAYIEGIHNLYEFDCGELSGWMYSVNGWFPNYGCSRYSLKEGDRIEWVYTCNLGEDVKN